MRTKQIKFAFIIAGFISCLISKAEDGAPLKQTNSDWHITSEAFVDPPFWLMPTNVPYRLTPLKNGHWIWTTNMNSILDDTATHHQEIDYEKEQQIKLQQKQRMDATDPPGIAHVPGYTGRRWDEKHVWNTNMTENWPGIWTEDTNTGWRIRLQFDITNTPDPQVGLSVGSTKTNSGPGLLPAPDGKYAKLELQDANGRTVPLRPGAALKLFEQENAVQPMSEKDHVNKQPPPSADDASVEENYPDTISDLRYSRWKNGAFLYHVGFVSNGPPCYLSTIEFNDIFSIKKEGDYTLRLQPVLFRMHYDGWTFQGYLERVDLPSITTKVHLLPNVK
jgi:hypothetical protein